MKKLDYLSAHVALTRALYRVARAARWQVLCEGKPNEQHNEPIEYAQIVSELQVVLSVLNIQSLCIKDNSVEVTRIGLYGSEGWSYGGLLCGGVWCAKQEEEEERAAMRPSKGVNDDKDA